MPSAEFVLAGTKIDVREAIDGDGERSENFDKPGRLGRLILPAGEPLAKARSQRTVAQVVSTLCSKS